MPVYGYRCTNQDCQHEANHYHGMNESPNYRCEHCDYTMKRLVSGVAFRFSNPRGTMGIRTNGGSSPKIDISN